MRGACKHWPRVACPNALVAGQMAIAWLLTLPAAAAVGAVAGWVAGTGTVGTTIVAVVAVAIGAGIYVLSRRRPVTADNVNDVPEPSFVSTSIQPPWSCTIP